MSLTGDLITLIRSKQVRGEDLELASLCLLDTVASACAGSATPVGRLLRDWAENFPRDRKRDALLMGALSHITETDDLHRASVTHPGCVVVPAILALARPLSASGSDLLRAMLCGYEAMCRIGSAVGPAHYRVWHNTATCGPFGSAMASATLLGLDDAQTRDALGNAGTQAGGLWQFLEEGAMSKHLHAGRAAESGMLAAELAAHGFTGPAAILEGEKGFFAGACPDPAPERILEEAGSEWQLTQTSIKPWPSCRHTHPVIDCALELHGLLHDAAIRTVEIQSYQAALDICDCPAPSTEYQAKFSLQHTAATALLDGRVGLDSFDPSARARSQELCAMTTVQAKDPFHARYPDAWGASLSVTTAEGELLQTERRDCKGDPELSLGADEMRAKALDLMRSGGLDHAEAVRLSDDILTLPHQAMPPNLFDQYYQLLA